MPSFCLVPGTLLVGVSNVCGTSIAFGLFMHASTSVPDQTCAELFYGS